MTDTEARPPQSVEAFYDRLAPDYDLMTTFDKRFVQESPFFNLLVQRHRFATALDAGSGTGFHSIVLGRLGVRVTAVDLSSRMLDRLARHAADEGLDVRTIQSGFADLPSRVAEPFGAVFCMGNTLAHLIGKGELAGALEAFARLLTPEGILFAQVLNYDRILRTHPEIQAVKETPEATYIRSYAYGADTIRFTIRKVPRAGGGPEQTQSVELRPVRSRELSDLLEQAGFGAVTLYGSIAMEPFDPATSKDLVVLARRNSGA